MIKKLVSSLFSLLLLLLVGCGNNTDNNIDASLLVSTPEGNLTREELSAVLPRGLSEKDSALFAEKYIRIGLIIGCYIS